MEIAKQRPLGFDVFAKALSLKRKCFSLQQWPTIGFGLSLFIAFPILSVAGSFFFPKKDIWEHLISTVLQTYIYNSFLMLFVTGIGVGIIGTITAWIVTRCDFRGKNIYEFLLLLPLTAPAYVISFTYSGLLDFAGPIQSYLRDHGYTTGWFPELHSLGGACFIYIFVFYPYVYLMTRAAFMEQSCGILEASRIFGCTRIQAFRRITFPYIRPALAVGVSLAFMEVLSSFATLEYFGVESFVTGVYRIWAGYGDVVSASQISAILMFFMLSLTWFERFSRRKVKYYQKDQCCDRIPRIKLKGWQKFAAHLTCLTPVLIGFFIPVATLTYNTFSDFSWLHTELLSAAFNSFSLSAISALFIVSASLIMAYAYRNTSSPLIRSFIRFSTYGYALPGTILAVGVLLMLTFLNTEWTYFFMSGSVIALVLTYLVRFTAISYGTIESSFQNISPNLEEASRILGKSRWTTLKLIYKPLMTPSLGTAALLVFVEVMKELPATLILRPFNFPTLSIYTYELATDERLLESAPSSLMIVLVGLLPLLLITRLTAHTFMRKVAS